jgi:anti-sigma factor RsiW
MKFDRTILDAYLDGQLPDAQATAVRESALSDPQLRDLLGRLKSQHALRAAALASYEPDEATASALTAALLDQVSAPIGRIGIMKWTRQLGAVAAMLLIGAGAFLYGRSSAPVATTAATVVVRDHYVVQIVTSTGEATEHLFASKEDANDFVEEVKRQQNGTVVAGVF